MPSAATITTDYSKTLGAIPHSVREEVIQMHQLMLHLDSEPNLQAACSKLAPAMQKGRGASASSLRRKYYAWVKAGRSPLALIDRCRAGRKFWAAPSAALPPEFIEFWRGLCERNQRKCAPAYRALIRQWQCWCNTHAEGYAIPGYSSPPPPSSQFCDHPDGWSMANLGRHKPTRFELVAARIGRSAARHLSPLVLTTRAGLRVGQFIMIDDMWHDFKVVAPGQRSTSRLLQLHAHDLYSACNFARGYKPTIENDDTGVTERTKLREVVFLLAHVFGRFGYLNADCGTTIIAEHGTAAVDETLEKLLYDLSGGRIQVQRSGMEGLAAFSGMYPGRGKGNYRFKASLESSGNLIHNETANTLLFPGQTGSNSRINCPEELAGRERHTDALIRAILAMPPDRQALLRLPFLRLDQAIPLVEAIHDLVNARTEHDLEGWSELLTSEFRLDVNAPWLPVDRVLQLPDAQRAAVNALAELPGHHRIRKLSPKEVWTAGQGNFTPLSPRDIALILGRDFGREVTVRDGVIEVQDSSIAPEPMQWEARTTDGWLQDGLKAAAVLNPFDTESIHLFDAAGRYIGTCPLRHRVRRDDEEALKRAMDAASRALKERLAPVARRGADITRQRIADAKHNAAVLGDAPVTTTEKQRAKDVRQHEGDAADFLPGPPEHDPAVTELEGSVADLL